MYMYMNIVFQKVTFSHWRKKEIPRGEFRSSHNFMSVILHPGDFHSSNDLFHCSFIISPCHYRLYWEHFCFALLLCFVIKDTNGSNCSFWDFLMLQLWRPAFQNLSSFICVISVAEWWLLLDIGWVVLFFFLHTCISLYDNAIFVPYARNVLSRRFGSTVWVQSSLSNTLSPFCPSFVQ